MNDFSYFLFFKSSSHRVEHQLFDQLIPPENLCRQHLNGFADFLLQLFQATYFIVTDPAHHQHIHVVDFAEFWYRTAEVTVLVDQGRFLRVQLVS
jgi:hypothetical protein